VVAFDEPNSQHFPEETLAFIKEAGITLNPSVVSTSIRISLIE
jgi:hypothetical protein